MTNILLFATTVLLWGTTWIAIAFQVGPVPALVSVFYRFALAAALFFALLAATGRLRAPTRRDAPFILAQALCLFSCNFLCFYNGARFIPSGLESVIFSLATVFNAVNARLFFGERITGRALIAGGLGVAGVALMFAHDLMVEINLDVLKGVGLSVLGTTLFSLGNMVSRRNSKAGIPPLTANAWGMAYASLALLALLIVTGTPLVIPTDAIYLGALVHLSVLGSIVGFTTYLMLVARIGSDRAAYATVMFPIIALALSAGFEGYVWDTRTFLGLALALAGNVVAFAGVPTLRRRATA